MLNVNFPTNKIELENKINKKNKFSAINFREVSLKENVHDFSIDYNAIDKSNIWNLKLKLKLNHKYLLVKNNI